MGSATGATSKGADRLGRIPGQHVVPPLGLATATPAGSSRDHPIVLDGHEERAPQSQRKRKATEADQQNSPQRKKEKKADVDITKIKPPEMRKGRFRKEPTNAFMTVRSRAMTQRMFVIERRRGGTEHEPNETIDIAGTTGNLYTVFIGLVPSCNCPHARKGNQCKHIVYVLANTLKARFDLQYQMALLSWELREILENAPPIRTETTSAQEDTDGARKAIEDDCPICCVEFDQAKDSIVYCKAACGNNIHKECFLQWAAQKRAQGAEVTCPFCRTAWEDDEDILGKINTMAGTLTSEGYMNVANQLGISGYRDTSTYHGPWVSSMRRAGGLADEDPHFQRC